MIIHRTLTTFDGHKVRVEVDIDEGAKLDRCIARLANRARQTKSQKASDADGAISVRILPAKAETATVRVAIAEIEGPSAETQAHVIDLFDALKRSCER